MILALVFLFVLLICMGAIVCGVIYLVIYLIGRLLGFSQPDRICCDDSGYIKSNTGIPPVTIEGDIMINDDLQPEFSEKLKKITAKMKNTRDIGQLKILVGGLSSLLHRYCGPWDYEALYKGITEAIDKGDIDAIHLSAETIEDALA